MTFQELTQFKGRHPGAAAAAGSSDNPSRNDNTKTMDDVQVSESVTVIYYINLFYIFFIF